MARGVLALLAGAPPGWQASPQSPRYHPLVTWWAYVGCSSLPAQASPVWIGTMHDGHLTRFPAQARRCRPGCRRYMKRRCAWSHATRSCCATASCRSRNTGWPLETFSTFR
eukprot:scaffold6628_cov59-Phaeocystis_antarctica.AAC.1